MDLGERIIAIVDGGVGVFDFEACVAAFSRNVKKMIKVWLDEIVGDDRLFRRRGGDPLEL